MSAGEFIPNSIAIDIQDSKLELFDSLGHGVDHLLLHSLPRRYYKFLHLDSLLSHVKHHFKVRYALQLHEDGLLQCMPLLRRLELLISRGL